MSFLQSVWALIERQPVRFVSAVAALLNVAVAFGLGWTGEQVGLVNIAIVAIVAFFVPGMVTPLSAPKLPEGSEVSILGGGGTVATLRLDRTDAAATPTPVGP